MSQIHNLSKVRPVFLKPSSTVPTGIKTLERALKTENTIRILPGTYDEDIIIEKDVQLLGSEDVKIRSIVIRGSTVTIEKCHVNEIHVDVNSSLIFRSGSTDQIESDGFLDGHLVDCNGLVKISGSSTFRNSTLDSVVCKRCVLYMESSTIENGASFQEESIGDVRSSTLISKEDDIITVDEGSRVQLFNCIVSGTKNVKSGPGRSTRSNVIPLGIARDFTGGINERIDIL